MTHTPPRGTLLELPLIEERYGRAFLTSVAFHGLLLIFFLVAPFIMPKASPIRIGTGPGGGSGSESYTVGIADDLGGGAGLIKPATTPQPPVLPVEKPAKKEVKKEDTNVKAVPLPDAATARKKAAKPVPAAASNQIPVADAKGAGGAGGVAGGSGGGIGSGVGVSIGAGPGGVGDSWYARVVEQRIGANWSKPVGPQQRIEIVYSFIVGSDGRIDIDKITLEKSSGNDALDLTAKRAIYASNPLAQPPPELRGRPLQFVCQFVYPPDKK